jgi:AraC-like DNA-binding protein
MDKERAFLAALRRGDTRISKRILDEILEILFGSIRDNFDCIRFRAVEVLVLLSRSVQINPEDPAALETHRRYLCRIQDCLEPGELRNILQEAAEQMSARIFSFRGIRHMAALRRAERYIWEHYTEKIRLGKIAGAAGLSPAYFCTIFKAERGETLASYLNRIRVEKAMSLLETGLPLDKIALASGFGGPSWFSKVFKTLTGISPGKYRRTGCPAPDNFAPRGESKHSAYPSETEQIFLSALRRGNTQAAKTALDTFLSLLMESGSGLLLRYRAVEFIILLSRIALGMNHDAPMLEDNNRYIRDIQKTQSKEELAALLRAFVKKREGSIFYSPGMRHIPAIRRARRFIRENYTGKITLGDMSKAAGLSASYFSTIFKEETGENLSGHLNRIRIERACRLLKETSLSMGKIAASCGFEDPGWFSKIFKTIIGVSPGKFRNRRVVPGCSQSPGQIHLYIGPIPTLQG